jgi:pyruvate formate lyase activating enzyme
MLSSPSTPIEALEMARKIGLEKLNYVYSGNVVGHEGENTYCPNCDEMLIKRWGFNIQKLGLTEDNHCPSCGEKIAIIR